MARKKPRNHSAKAVEPGNRRRRGLLWGGIVVVALAVGGALFYCTGILTLAPSMEFILSAAEGLRTGLSRKDRDKQA